MRSSRVIVFFALCTAGEAARGEYSSLASVTPVGSHASASVFDGLPDDMEKILDNRLASSSWRKVEAALKYWRPFVMQKGWPTIIRSGDPLRGGKLAGFVTMLVLTWPMKDVTCPCHPKRSMLSQLSSSHLQAGGTITPMDGTGESREIALK